MPKPPRPPLAPYVPAAAIARPSDVLPGARLLPLDLVDANPAQSRQVFAEEALAELAASIAEHGVLEPILVRPAGDRYQAVAGERRVRAARAAGLSAIPAIVRSMTDEEAAWATATENLQRADLDLEDEARWFAYLQNLTGLSQRELAARLGKTHNYVSRRLRLLERPDLLAAVRRGQLTQEAALDQIAAERQPAGVYQPDTAPAPSAGVYQADTVRSLPPVYQPDTVSTAAGSGPAPIERAALDAAGDADDARLVPYRTRALRGAAATLRRIDWGTVPAGERAQVRAEIAALRDDLAHAEAALGHD